MKRIAAVLLGALLVSCSKTTPNASAFQIKSREQLVGGRRALAEVGDYKISNGLIHAIVQEIGTSRGFGAFGGSLIDIDLVRGTKGSGATGVNGRDWFTEMFPAFFLQAIEPEKVEVVADGSDGKAAILRVSGRGADFISITRPVNDTILPKTPLDFWVDYILEPGKQYLKIQVNIKNPDPAKSAGFALAVPFGFVVLLGEGQRLFIPEAGFDMRFHLDEVYKRPSRIDALPGVVTDFLATEGEGVSYALAASPRGGGYVANAPDIYPGGKPDSMLIPIASSSFLGAFWAKPPNELAPGATFSYSGYLAVGGGDVSQATKIIYDIDESADRGKRPTKYGTISGRVVEGPTRTPMEGISVVLKDQFGMFQSQARTQKGGIYSAVVPPGTYTAYATDLARDVATAGPVEVKESAGARIDLELGQPAMLNVIVKDERGRNLPAKISVEGVYDYVSGNPARTFLYDLKVGEKMRNTDLDADDSADPGTRRYMEKIFYAANGIASREIRPGRYKVWATRGPEYELASAEVNLVAGKSTTVGLKLVQSVDTKGWVSGDFHVHSIHSVDSPMDLPDRVMSYAVEGVDFISATDHNYVTDFQPTIDGLGLADWLKAGVGLELTTLEMGHFNAFPIKLDPGPVTHGSFAWFRRPPGELIAQLRGLGADPKSTIIQVNHPRDSVLGYFNAFNVGTYTGTPLPDDSLFSLDRSPNPDGSPGPYDQRNFSLDFDAIEIFNGKREELRFTYRIPAVPPAGREPTVPACPPGPQTIDCIPPPGEVLNKVVDVSVNGTTVQQLQPVYPGSLDDWFNLIARGHRFTATGNSDSHGKGEEAGLPRTWLRTGSSGDGSMRGLSEEVVMDSLRRGEALVSNGPFVEVWVNGEGMGRTVVAPDKAVEVRVKVQAPSWMDISRILIRRGGKDMVRFPDTVEIPVPPSQEVERYDATRRFENVPDDSFFVVEVYGEKSMWPLYTPYEVPSIQISDAVAVIGGSFGFGNTYGKYKPTQITQVKPYAFTNPIFVTWTAKSALRAPRRVLPVGATEAFKPRSMPNVLKLFQAFHGDVE